MFNKLYNVISKHIKKYEYSNILLKNDVVVAANKNGNIICNYVTNESDFEDEPKNITLWLLINPHDKELRDTSYVQIFEDGKIIKGNSTIPFELKDNPIQIIAEEIFSYSRQYLEEQKDNQIAYDYLSSIRRQQFSKNKPSWYKELSFQEKMEEQRLAALMDWYWYRNPIESSPYHRGYLKMKELGEEGYKNYKNNQPKLKPETLQKIKEILDKVTNKK